ncbi:MarR family transcriptional regulator [uncultured Leclercia sp.]|uniref:MarR family winged helix-turn-helix transcriptional regulator n=1 Tax=uncultured Leclercia sp. TaxID=332959 RepID=UPI00259435B7|nr:MarR family transcriptional regulator [uncultured Leclercia sp.]
MTSIRESDAVARIVEQWRREKPELDTSVMGMFGRLQRCSLLLEPMLLREYKKYELVTWEFDMLATLRRAGEPFILTPTELFSTLMITSGTMTHRLKLLEARGLISREPNPEDARSMRVKLSDAGRKLIDSAIVTHVENQHKIAATMPADKLRQLDELLAEFLNCLEQK